MQYLDVSNIDFTDYIAEMTFERETVWNTKAGRTLTAEFVGRIVAEKWKIMCKTRPLTQAESAKIHSAIRQGDFVTVKFIPPDSGSDTKITRTLYVSSISNPVYSYSDKLKHVRYSSMTFNLIEK